MGYLITFHGPWIAGAAVIGLAMGWVALVQRTAGLSGRGLRIALALLVAAIGLSVSHQIPGRFGYWLDLGLAMLAAYFIGCAVGSWLRERLLWRSTPQA
jgi:hypothetical protein